MPSQAFQTPDEASVVLRLVGGDPAAADEVLALARSSEEPSLLAAAALLSSDHAHLARANELANTTRDRQLIVLVEARLRGDSDRFDVLVRDHLADYPDHLLAAWIAGQHQ